MFTHSRSIRFVSSLAGISMVLGVTAGPLGAQDAPATFPRVQLTAGRSLARS